MNFINIKYKANYYVLLMLAFVIPLERKLIAPFIILFFITSLFNGELKINEKKNVLLFLSIYIVYLLGLLYSDNLQAGITDIVSKLSLVIFPISFVLAKINFRKNLGSILKSFIDGCFISSILSIINSLIYYYFDLDASSFFYNNISLFAHPSYLAMMMNLCIIIIYYSLLQKDTIVKLNNKTNIFLILFFSFFIILLSSKTGLITVIFIHLVAISFWVIKHNAFIKGLSAILLLLASLTITYNYSNLFKGRIDEIISVTQSKQSGNSTTSARKTIWITSLSLIKSSPLLGYGTGDAKDVLMNEYKNKKLNYLSSKKLNAHNQFLQTTLAIGLIGGFTLIAMLLIPLFLSLKQQHYVYLSFLLLIIINFLTESMLERQLGVVFYSFFNTLFFVTLNPRK